VSPGADVWALGVDDAPLCFVDLELTSLDPEAGEICELCLIRARGREEREALVSLVRPSRGVGESRAYHGLDDEALARAPSFAALAPRVASLLDGAVLVGHAVGHDAEFLRVELGRAGLTASAEGEIDTLALARRAFGFRSNKLGALAAELGIPHARAHRAEDDARATMALFFRLVAELEPATLGDLSAVKVGGRAARPDVVDACRAAVGAAPLALRYRRSGRSAEELRFVVTAVEIADSGATVVGYTLPGRARRVLLAHRIVAVGPAGLALGFVHPRTVRGRRASDEGMVGTASMGAPHSKIPGAPARLSSDPAALLARAAGGRDVALGKLARLARGLSAYALGADVEEKLLRLRALGVIDASPTSTQLAVGSVDMLRFWINPAAADYYEARGINYAFHQVLRFLDEPASLLDPIGLFSTEDGVIGHLMQVVHANPVYDLQLLSLFDTGHENLERQLRDMVAGTHPRAVSISAIVEEADYHARLLEFVVAWRRDPSVPPLVRSNVAAREELSALDRTFGSLTTSMRYFSRLPTTPLGGARHLLSTRRFPAHLGEP